MSFFEGGSFYLEPLYGDTLRKGGLARHVDAQLYSDRLNRQRTVLIDEIATPYRNMVSLTELIDAQTDMHPYGLSAGTIVGNEVAPVSSILMKMLKLPDSFADDYDIDKGQEPIPHFIRGSTTSDILLYQRPAFRRRSRVMAELVREHEKEVFKPGTFGDEVKKRLFRGSDLDVVIELPIDEIASQFLSSAEEAYKNNYRLMLDQPHEGNFLTPIVQHQANGSSVHVYEVAPSIVPLSARGKTTMLDYGLFMPQKTYLVFTTGIHRSGVPYADISICLKPDQSFQITENNTHELDSLFSIGITSFATLPPHLQALDRRSSPLANSWDQKGHGMFRRIGDPTHGGGSANGSLFIDIPAESRRSLTRPLELGEKLDDRSQLAFFEETLRVMRKSIIGERNLELSPEGRSHLQRTHLEKGFRTALSDAAWDTITATLGSRSFERRYKEEWKSLNPAQREYLMAKFGAEMISMFMYAPRKTLELTRSLGLHRYFPELKNMKPRVWGELVSKLPLQETHEDETVSAMRPRFKEIENLIRGLVDDEEKVRTAIYVISTYITFKYHPILHRLEHALLSIPKAPLPESHRNAKRILKWMKIYDQYYSPHEPQGLLTAAYLFRVG